MKDLSIYFSDFALQVNSSSADNIGSKIVCASQIEFPIMDLGSIAIFYVPEYRNSSISKEVKFVDDFRKAFFSLYPGNWGRKIYDLGVLNPGNSYDDTHKAVVEIISELIKNKITPIMIGGSNDLAYSLYCAYQNLEQTVNIVGIDSMLDLGNPDEEISDKNWLSKIIIHKPGFLFNYSLVGYQSYYVNTKEVELLSKMYFDTFRLGDFYADEKMVEPLVRNADILSFDLNAIRNSDYKANTSNSPHGLYGEDACKIMRYAGWSDKLTSVGIFNFCHEDQSLLSDVNLLSQMVWYFVDGFNSRKKDYPVGTKTDYIKYSVSLDDFKDEIIFYKSDKSGRWWMEVPYPKTKGLKFQRHLLVPCNYEVYQKALQNEMPDLWWKTFQKLT